MTDDRENNEAQEELKQTQAVRAELRERYLKVLKHSLGKPCKINLYESTSLHCDFSSADIHGTEFLVENLQTPTESYSSAILRSADIIAIEIGGGSDASNNS